MVVVVVVVHVVDFDNMHACTVVVAEFFFPAVLFGCFLLLMLVYFSFFLSFLLVLFVCLFWDNNYL